MTSTSAFVASISKEQAIGDINAIEDVTLPDSFGRTQRIGDLWENKPVVFVWLRHYG